MSFTGFDHFRQQKHLQRPRFADQPREPLCSTPSCDETKRGAAMAEDRSWRGNAVIAGQRQVHSTAHAIPSDRSDYGNWKTIHYIGEHLTPAGKLEGCRSGELGNLLEVRACREKFVIACDDESLECSCIGLELERADRIAKRCDHSRREDVGSIVG